MSEIKDRLAQDRIDLAASIGRTIVTAEEAQQAIAKVPRGN